MILIKMQEEQPNTIKPIMTQHLLKPGLKEWETKYHNVVNSEMKQLHFRNNFKPIHWTELEKNLKE